MTRFGRLIRLFLPWLGFLAILAVVIWLSYLNQWRYHYLVPPGGDAINHNLIVTELLKGHYRAVSHYHIVWHAVVAAVAQWRSIQGITVMAWLAPGLLVSGSVAMFFFNKKFFGWTAGLVTLILFGLMSRQPLQTLQDGGFPNVLASATVLPLTLMALILWYERKRKVIYGLLFVASLILLVYSHNITTLYALPVIGVFMTVEFVFWLNRRGLPSWLAVFAFPALYLVLVLAAKTFLSLGLTSSGGIAASVVKLDWSWPFIHLIGRLDNPNAWLPIDSYPEVLGEAVVLLGALGALAAVGYFALKSRAFQGRAALVLLLWAMAVLAGSQTEAVGFPVRLTRDLAVPLCLLGGLFFQAIADYCRAKQLPAFLAILAVAIALPLGWPTLTDRYQQAVKPNPLIYHGPADQVAVDYMNEQLPEGAVVAVFQDDIYLPFFATHQKVLIDINENKKIRITDPTQVAVELPDVEYVYFEYRPQAPTAWNNNRANLKSYRRSKAVTLVFETKTPEKEVYLFKVNPTTAKKAAER